MDVTLDTYAVVKIDVLFPTYGTTVTNSLPRLRWNAIAEAASYQVAVWTNAPGLTLHESALIGTNTYLMSRPLVNGATYCWDVDGLDSASHRVGDAHSIVFSAAFPPRPTFVGRE